MTTAKQAYHHGDLRAALLDAVGDIIREHGAAAVSLRAAARRAGVSHSAPAHHFGDKAGLLTAYAARGFEVFGERMRRAFESETEPRAAFRAIGRAYVEFALEQRDYFEIMFRKDLHDRHDPELRAAGRAAFQVLLDAVAAMAAGADTRGVNLMHVAMSAWAGVHGIATLWMTGAPSMFTDEGIETLLEGIFEISHGDWLPQGQEPGRISNAGE